MNERQESRKRIALVDTSHIFRAEWHASGDQEVSYAFEKTKGRVARIAESGYHAVVCCFDVGPYLRAAVFPAYKANRETKGAEMVDQYRRIAQELAREFHVFGQKGHEADDLIATICAKFFSHFVETGIAFDLDIYSNDKDLLQLIRSDPRQPLVTVVSTSSGDRVDAKACFQKLGVHPEQVMDWICIQGDKSDNIPGLDGFGPKRAAELLERFGSLEAVYKQADEDPSKLELTAKLLHELMYEKGKVVTARQLVRLNSELELDIAPIIIGKKEVPVTKEENAPPQEGKPEDPEGEVDAPAYAPVPKIADKATYSILLNDGRVLTPQIAKLMLEMAKNFHASGYYRDKFGSVDKIFTVLELGYELGIAPQMALLQVNFIGSKITLASHLIIAKAKKDPSCVYLECVEADAEKAVYACKKKNFPRELTFQYTVQDAKNDGMQWANKAKNLKAMLRKTAGCQAARLFFPEAANGLYSPAEMGEDEHDGE